MGWRKDTTVREDAFGTAQSYYSVIREGMREKANHNKLEAQGCFAIIIGCTLFAPIFVSLGDGVVAGKIIPSVLSVIAAGLTSWLQLRKPQRLWALYRRAQRDLEQLKADYDFDDGEFEGAPQKDKLLARRVTAIARRVHDEWEGLVPDPDMLVSSKPAKIPERKNAGPTTTDRQIATQNETRHL